MAQSVVNSGNLTSVQTRAITLFAGGASLPEVAAMVGKSNRTLYRWLKQPDFAGKLNEATDRQFTVARRRLAAGMQTAIDTLINVAENEDMPPAVRVRASSEILSYAIRINEQHDLILRCSNT